MSKTITNIKIQNLNKLFKSCLDILRNDAEHLIGDEALMELSRLLVLKLSEKNMDVIINEIIKKHKDDGIYDQIKNMVKKIKFSEFVNHIKSIQDKNYKDNENDEINILFNYNKIWSLLSDNIKYKNIFEADKTTAIKQEDTIKNLLLKLNEIEFNDDEYDILGEAYERIFTDNIYGAGGKVKSELGQFFTPQKIKNLLIDLVNPKIKSNGEIESVLDPSAGTGGILNNVIKHYRKFEGIEISKDKLKEQLIKNIYGIEIKSKIFNLCASNMLINTGEILPNVILDDSIRNFHNIKVDNIIANPPFSVNINYDELKYDNEDIIKNYVPIKTGGKNSELMFLQMMIYRLNINGRCATVMLDGQKIYGKTSGYNRVREYLMKSCDLHEVIICPSGSFTSTGAKTCILFFTKKKERNEVIIKFNNKKLPVFINKHVTSKVKFYNFNLETEKKEFIKEVNIKDIAENNYSLSHTDYEVEEEKIITNEKFELKQLGEICEFLPKSKRNAKYGKSEGKYPFYTSSPICNKYSDDYEYEEYCIIIGTGGTANIKYNKQFSCSADNLIIKIKDEVNSKYIYYYLLLNIQKLEQLFKGALIKHISKSDIEKIKIPIPSIETQNKIIDYMDKINEEIKLIEFSKYFSTNIITIILQHSILLVDKLVNWYKYSISLKNQIQSLKNNQALSIEMMINNRKKYKMLGEICEFLPKSKRNAKYGKTEGKYPFFKSSLMINSYVNNPDHNIESIIIGDGGDANINYATNFSTSDHCYILQNIDIHSVNLKYIYYYIYTNLNILQKFYKGALIKNISKSDIEKIKIPIPSIETQNKIVDQLDSLDNLINLLQKQIDNNHRYAKEFILGFTNNLDNEDNQDNEEDSDENNEEESDEEHKSNSSDE